MVLYSHSVLLSANRAGLRVSCALPPAQALAPTSAPLFAAFSAVLILLVVGHIVNQMTEMIQLFFKKKNSYSRTHMHTCTEKLRCFTDPIYDSSHKQLHSHNAGDSEPR